MSYILMLDPEEPKQLEITFELVRKVLDGWGVKYESKYYDSPDRVHPHELYCEKGLFEIFISKDKDSLTLDGDWERTLDFLVLFRRHVTNSQKLLFFDQGYSNNMVLSPDVEKADITAIFGGSQTPL